MKWAIVPALAGLLMPAVASAHPHMWISQIVRPRHLQDAGSREQRAETSAGRSSRQIGGDEVRHGILLAQGNVHDTVSANTGWPGTNSDL